MYYKPQKYTAPKAKAAPEYTQLVFAQGTLREIQIKAYKRPKSTTLVTPFIIHSGEAEGTLEATELN